MSDQLSVTGTIRVINPTASYGAKNFTKREFVVDVQDGKYTQPIKFEVVKENCDKLDKYSGGDQVTVNFNLRGNEHNGKFYVSLVAWKMDLVGQSQQSQPQRRHESRPQAQQQVPVGGEGGNESYPF